MRTGHVAALALAISLAASTAWAQQPAGTPSEADALIEEGIRLRTDRHDDQALERFRRAYELSHGARALAQVALAEQALGRWVEADRDMGAALDMATDPWIQRNLAPLRQARQTIDEHLGSLEVRTNVPGAELWIGGARVATLPTANPVRVEIGAAQVQVRAEGYVPRTRTVTIEAGGLARESIDLSADTGGGSSGTGPQAPVDPRYAATALARRSPRMLFVASVAAGLPFYLPSVGIGVRYTVTGRIDVAARAVASYSIDPVGGGSMVAGSLPRMGVLLGGDGTVRVRPAGDYHPWYLGGGLALHAGLTWVDILMTNPAAPGMFITVSSLNFTYVIAGVFEMGLLLGPAERWDLSVRFMGGIGALQGVFSVGYAF